MGQDQARPGPQSIDQGLAAKSYEWPISED